MNGFKAVGYSLKAFTPRRGKCVLASDTFCSNGLVAGAMFSGNGVLAGATFFGNGVLAGATFSGNGVLAGATFSGNGVLAGATFSGNGVLAGVTTLREVPCYEPVAQQERKRTRTKTLKSEF
jgi:hypothetical protein